MERESEATSAQRRFYWRTSCVTLWVAAAALVLLLSLWRRPNSRLRKSFFSPFQVLIIGDCVFVFLTYLP
jgi:hypothetical protein